jgi:hypothetical protein
MSAAECVHEAVVVEAVLRGTWPSRCDQSLVAHANDCDICKDVAAIAALMHDDSERARYDVQVPAAGQVWWRSAIRARMESTEAAMRPMTVMQGITAAIALGVLLAVGTLAWPMLPPWGERAWAFAITFFPNAEVAASLAGGLRQSALLGLLGAVLLVLAPLLAIYVALSRE